MADSSGPINLTRDAHQRQGRPAKPKATRKVTERRRKPRRESIRQLAEHRFRDLMREATEMLVSDRHDPLQDIVVRVHHEYPVSRQCVKDFIDAGHAIFLEIEAAYTRSQAARTRRQAEPR